MRTLRTIHAVSLRVAPHWAICVILGAYFSVQMAGSATIAG
jgi:hypothetical protein